MTKLYMIKMSDGSNVMAEVEYNDSDYVYTLTYPLLIGSSMSQGGEVTTSLPYLPGMSGDSIIVPSTFIVTMSEVDHFFRQFYCISIMKFYMQNIMRELSLSGTTELDVEGIHALELKRIELENKYGTSIDMNVNQQDRILH